METSRFGNNINFSEQYEALYTNGATCDTYRTRMYGKMLFVKRLKPEFATDIKYLAAMRKEFEVGFGMEHPNLARYVSFNDNNIYIEYIDGETLTEKLKNTKEYFCNSKNSDRFITQLLSAVQYLHSHQTLHLDIKPDNIMLTRINNDVKLIDLGFCYTDIHNNTTGHTRDYCSPEQEIGEATDERSDIYTIGRIIELLPNSQRYSNIIARCTATDKRERYRKIEEIKLPRSRKETTKMVLLLLCALGLVLIFLYHTIHDSSGRSKNPEIQETTEPSLQQTPTIEENKPQVLTDNNWNTGSTNRNIEDPEITIPAIPGFDATSELHREAEKNLKKAYESGIRYTRLIESDFKEFKPKIMEYFKELFEFIENKENLDRYPTYIEYSTRYREVWRKTVKEIAKDEWTYRYYKSNDNPFSSYYRNLRDSIEDMYRHNADMLP